MTFDSNDELYISYWLQELKDFGIIDDFFRAESYTLNDPLIIEYEEEKQLKTKTSFVKKKQTLIPEKEYTPDFKIFWNQDFTKLYKFVSWLDNCKVQNIVVQDLGISILEVKPIYDKHNMIRLFKTNQAIMWSRHNIYVSLVDYESLFEKTFTPRRYIIENGTYKNNSKHGTKGTSKISWKVKVLEEFINNK